MKTALQTIIAVVSIGISSTGLVYCQQEVANPKAAIQEIRHHDFGLIEFQCVFSNTSDKKMQFGGQTPWKIEVTVTDSKGVIRNLRLIYPFQVTIEPGDSHTFPCAICPWEGKPAWECHSENIWFCLPPKARPPIQPGEEFDFRHWLPPLADFSIRDGFGVFPIDVECRFSSDSEAVVRANVTIPRRLTPESFGFIMGGNVPVVFAIDCHAKLLANLRVMCGDRFREVNGIAIATTADFRKALLTVPRGRPVQIVIESAAFRSSDGTRRRRTMSVTFPNDF